MPFELIIRGSACGTIRSIHQTKATGNGIQKVIADLDAQRPRRGVRVRVAESPLGGVWMDIICPMSTMPADCQRSLLSVKVFLRVLDLPRASVARYCF
jgi:hypothetical protein